MEQRENGFTLIELLIVIAVVVAVAIVALVNLTGNRNETGVNSGAQQIVTLARQAESDSAAQLQGMSWGIHFSNAANAAPSYALFKGSSYSATNTVGTYRLPAGVGYLSSTLPLGSTRDVTFSPVSGAASTSTNITIYSLANPSLATTISITSLGLVTIGSLSNTDRAAGGLPVREIFGWWIVEAIASKSLILAEPIWTRSADALMAHVLPPQRMGDFGSPMALRLMRTGICG